MGDAPLYVSVDIDVLDPAHAPGTGTPEAGGLTSRELLSMVRGLAPARIVGADVVEVSPAYDHAEITAVAAAHVLYELLTVMALGEPLSRDAEGGRCNSAFTTGKRSPNLAPLRCGGRRREESTTDPVGM